MLVLNLCATISKAISKTKSLSIPVKFISTVFRTSCGFITIFHFIVLLRITALEIDEFSTLQLSFFRIFHVNELVLNFCQLHFIKHSDATLR